MAEFRVDLADLSANLRAIRTRVGPAEVMLVVKDDAYGHGVAAVVRRAWDDGIRWFGAFDVRTASTVRDVVGADARIFAWLAGSAAEIRAAVGLGLDLGVGDSAVLEEIAAIAPTRLRVHLKVDTGLHRNGVRPEQWRAFVERVAALEQAGTLDVVGVWSHIAEASDAEDDAARDVFARAVDEARAAGLRPRMLHLAASAASFARRKFRYDMVRVGAFAYGIRSADGRPHDELGVVPVGTLWGRVVDTGPDGVRLDVGTHDGIFSTLAGGFDVVTPDGPRRVVDVHPDGMLVERWSAEPGQEIAVFGRTTASATDLAETVDTIGEEIVVRLSPRIPRRYTDEGS